MMSAAGDLTHTIKRIREHGQESRELFEARYLSKSKHTNKSIATRERILSSACELMISRGGTDFQMADIAKMCNMSKGSLYYYFADRESLIEAAFARAADDLAEAVAGAVAEAPNAITALSNIALEISQKLSEGSPIALALTHDITLSGPMIGLDASDTTSQKDTQGSMLKILRVIETQLDRGKKEGSIRVEVNTGLAAIFIIGGFHTSLQMYANDFKKGTEKEFISTLFKSVLYGIANPSACENISFNLN